MFFLYLITIAVLYNIKNQFQKILKKPAFLSVFLVSSLYLISKVMGLGRSIIINNHLDKISSDIFYKADVIPSQLSAILLMGTIISSVLPIASRLINKDSKHKDEDYTKTYSYFNLVSGILLVFLFIIIILCQVFLEPLLQLITDPTKYQEYQSFGKLDEYILTSRILLLTPINFAIQALFGVILNLKKRFNIFALAGVITNFGSISGAILASSSNFVSIPIGMFLGGFVTSLVYIGYAIKDGYRLPSDILELIYWQKLFRIYKTELKDTVLVFVPRMFLLDGFLISNVLLSKLSNVDGQISAFDYATSIQGAFYVIISSIGIILFPDISRTVNDKTINLKDFWNKIHGYLKLTILLGIITSIIAIPGSFAVMRVFELFGKGQGTDQNNYIIILAAVSSFRLFFMAIKEILDKVFYARESRFLPITLSVLANIFQIGFILGLGSVYEAGIIASMGLLVYYAVWVILALLRVRWEVRELK